ncbi:SusC/RagA family TonB-linked outer membrane protein [Chitinophaga deserti]|uniref:SusC/RagA family TonB-linked outer membrane protein n=1 Tax=Chitinophaga deserti TaxID=2164099 RepID=UPI000D6B4AB9|nr:SusC/RagA family TonB-linked outer membrane protein [Chitinophaga deserti]
MKLTPAKALRSCVMLCALLCLYHSVSAAQPEYKVTLKAHQTELKSILRSIEDQTGLYFMFNTDIIRLQEKISIHLQAVRLEEALQQLFAARGISWSIMEKAIVLKNSPTVKKLPAARAITGTVTSEKGEPLPGATIQIQGTNIGALTNAIGQFNITGIPPGRAVLQARFTGFKPEDVELGIDDKIIIRLKPSVSQLDETVVVAYGTATERSTTGAVSVVKGEQIQTLPNRSFDKSLQGLVPGLRVSGGTGQPGGGLSNMIVRGISTGTEALGGTSVRNPLIVIDGIPVTQDVYTQMSLSSPLTPLSNPLSQINPNDIAEISVLKDAAAISLYGSKASNGVILVTTKKGGVSKTRFTFNHQTDLSFRPPTGQRLMNREEYLDLLFETYRQANPATWTDEAIRADLYKKLPYRVNGTDTSFYDTPDWQKLIYREPALTVANNLSISGGTPTQRYYINLEHTHQDGIVRSTGFDRTSLRVNIDNKPANWLKLGISTLLSYNKQSLADNNEKTTGLGLTDIISPLLPNRLDNGAYKMNFTWGANLNRGNTMNPVAVAEYNYNRNTAYRGISSLNGELTFLRYFSFQSILGIDFMQTESKQKISPLFNMIGNGQLSDYDMRRSSIISTNSLHFRKQLARDHQLHILISQEAQIQEQKITSLTATGFDQYTSPYLNDVFSKGYGLSSTFGNTQKKNTLSQFAQLNYNFREKYYLTGSWRRDGTSVFGQNNPWGNYGSVGAAWILSSEHFIKSLLPVVNFLKLRGSLGIAGNAAALNQNLPYHEMNVNYYLGSTALMPRDYPGNPSIQWEKTRQWNLGLQAGMWNNRIYLESDYYYKFTGNIIFDKPLPSYTGFNFVADNIGDMRNSGIEVSLKADILRETAVRWNLYGNWSRNSNKLIKSNGQFRSQLATPLMAAEVGREFNSFYLPIWAGANPENGSPQWLDESGKPTGDYTKAAKQFLGQSQPKGFGAITNNLAWKGWSALIQFQYQYGGHIYNEQNRIFYSDGLYAFLNAPTAVANRWKQPGDVSDNPLRKLSNTQGGTQNSSRYLFKSDYVRLQLIGLSWHFPREIMQRWHLQSLKVFGQASNLAVWKPAKGIDPDNINPVGMVGFVYPNARTFTIGLNTSF